MPPPEWLATEAPHSAASVALARYFLREPVPRRNGPRAELEAWAARMNSANARGDDAAERSSATTLARGLAALGSELDHATKYARRALLLGDDPDLRSELSEWFAMLGEPALAAATLRPLAQQRAADGSAALWLRVATLYARAGEANAVREVLQVARQHVPRDAALLEMLGALGLWAPEVVTPDEAARSYLDAADCRNRVGERAAAFEDVLRALEVAPASAAVAQRLSQLLSDRGRAGAADEVRRAQASQLGPLGRSAHIARAHDAARAGDFARALAAALDANLDAQLERKSLRVAADAVLQANSNVDPLQGIEPLLLRLGLSELLSARLELGADLAQGAERALLRLAAARLCVGPLARPERAIELSIDALVADPSSEAARAALLQHFSATRDHGPYVEGLLRVAAQSEQAEQKQRVLEELAEFAEQQLSDANLSLYCRRALVALGVPALEPAHIERLQQRVRLTDETLEQLRSQLSGLTGEERIEPLSRVASLLLSRPEQTSAALGTLLELVTLVPEERSYQLAVERLLIRAERFEELEAFHQRQVDRSKSASERVRARLSIAWSQLRRGDSDGAAATLYPVLDEDGVYPAGLALSALVAAQRGDAVPRARALLRLSPGLAAPLRATLCAFAGEALLAAGEVEAARRATDQAVAADPSLARAATARALVGTVTADRWGAQAIERAMGVVVPRAALCSALATAYDRTDEERLAFAFCLRRNALRPGDLEAARDRLQRAINSRDAGLLGDTLAWLLSQAQPMTALTSEISDALRLLAPLDPARGGALGRRALDVLGARATDLRLSLLSVADVVGERGLAIATIERWLASGAPSGDRAELLLDLSRRRRAAGDADGAARALMRAIRDGAWATSVLGELDVALPARGSDGEIALLFARAEALSALSEADQRGTARAWRELGAAYWDLAGDERSALKAWQHAATLDPDHGVEGLASDLFAFGGAELALTQLEILAEARGEPSARAYTLGVAANLAHDTGRKPRAFDLARRALELDPSRADVLAVAERSADERDLEPLVRLYVQLADAALGRFGERAVFYRAARQLEKRWALEPALSLSLRAFEAVPSSGVVYVTMVRLVERTGRTADAIRSIERVAAKLSDNQERAGWLHRAALLAGPGEEGLRQRVDVLLRALVVRADPDTLRGLVQAVLQLGRLSPEELPSLELRFTRALEKLLPQLEGSDGARIAIAGARCMLEGFGTAAVAVAALERAVECDAGLDEYAELAPFAAPLAELSDGLIEAFSAEINRATSSAGVRLLELLARMAEARGDLRRAAQLFLAAAERLPTDAVLIAEAERVARASGDASLIALALDIIPLGDRIGMMIELAQHAERAGDVRQALQTLEEARTTAAGKRDERLADQLLRLYRQTGRTDQLVRSLGEELTWDTLEPARRVALALELCELCLETGQPARAAAALETALKVAPRDANLLRRSVELARVLRDRDRLLRDRRALCEVTERKSERLALLRELAEEYEQSSEYSAAAGVWAEVLDLDSEDLVALSALEREAERSGDHDGLIKLLARRAALAQEVDEVRRIRLRRAAVLEQRLGRAEDARIELEAITSSTGDHLSVLRVLADLNERLGAPLKAAPLWLRASAVALDKEEACDLMCRACSAYLSGGDSDSAARVLEGMEVWSRSERVATLAVETERRRQDPLALADALDDLSTVGNFPPQRRAELLVEAAETSLQAAATELALARAARAAELTPLWAPAQVLARYLEYRVRGAGGAEDAEHTFAALESSGLEQLSAEQRELGAFLQAEALDRLGRAAEARALLARTESAIGRRPLLALAQGERLSRDGELEDALPYFDCALSGDLRSVRGRGRVAWHAAEVSRTFGDLDRTATYLEIAAEDAETSEQANARIRELFSQRISSPVPAAIERPAYARRSRRPSEPVPSERALASLGRYSRRPSDSSAEERVSLPPRKPSAAPPAATANRSNPARPEHVSSPPADRVVSGRYSLRGEAPRDASQPPVETEDYPSTQIKKLGPDEVPLFEQFAAGSIEAGRELALQLEHRPERSHDLIAVCRRLVIAQPADPWALDRLHRAALADKNLAYARAIEHVIGVLDPSAAAVEPPPLGEQSEQPDAVRALLLRDHSSVAFEALALVWEGAEHVFRRDASTYGVTGLERVPVNAPTPLARTYASAARALGMLRTPLFQRRSAGAVTVSLALLSPPAVVLSGDIRHETAELRFHLGAMLLAATSQFALLIGSPESQARAVLRGLGFAFGPPQLGVSAAGAVPNLAEVLWESIPARFQRRLRELCNDPAVLDYENVVRAARSITRRAGGFACGDLGVALRETCNEEGIAEAALASPSGIAELSERSPSIRSLLLLATSPEYAQIRWWQGKAAR